MHMADIHEAATVVLLRDGDGGLETLMLRKNSRLAFGGMWVFPGGRIDDGDRAAGADELTAAANAAVREAAEESVLALDATARGAETIPHVVLPGACAFGRGDDRPRRDPRPRVDASGRRPR